MRSKSGAAAGLSVDLLFFPIDTVKTRLQSRQGFLASGGFKGIYKGIGSVFVGGAPGGACCLHSLSLASLIRQLYASPVSERSLLMTTTTTPACSIRQLRPSSQHTRR